MTRTLKVLISDTWASGGASTFVATLARGLATQGHVVDVALGYRDSPAVGNYEAQVRRLFRPPYNFNRVMLAGDYDVLHVTTDDLAPPFDYGRRTRRLGLRAAVVATVHTGEALVPPGADVVAHVSQSALVSAKGHTHPAHMIPNGVDAPWLRATADKPALTYPGGPVAVWVGRVAETVPQKDFRGFAYAIQGIRRMGWHVLVIDGAPADAVDPASQQLDRWFPAGGVTYLNQVPSSSVAGALLHAGRSGGALISTSRTEAAPFIALEALALGCPVVAPRIPGYQQLEESGHVTGYVGVDGLLDVLENSTFRGATTELPRHLHAEEMVRRYLELYWSAADRDDDKRLRTRLLRATAIAATDSRVQSVRASLARRHA